MTFSKNTRRSLISAATALPLLLQPFAVLHAQSLQVIPLQKISLMEMSAAAISVSQQNSSFIAQPNLSNVGTSFTFLLTLKDGAGNPVMAKNVDILVSKNLQTAVHYARTTDQNGQATVTILSDEVGDYIANTVADSAHFIASAVVTGGRSNGQSSVPFNTTPSSTPVTPPVIQVVPPAATTTTPATPTTVSQNTSSLTAQPQLSTAGSDIIFTLTLKDANNAPVTSKDVVILVSKNLQTATHYTRTTNQDGQASVTIHSDDIGDYIANSVVDNVHLIASAIVTAGNQPATQTQSPQDTTFQTSPIPNLILTRSPNDATSQSAPSAETALQYASGRLILNTNQNILTYTDPTTQQTLRMWESRWAFNALKGLATTVTDATLRQIPQPGQEKQQNIDLRRSFAGKILVTKSDKSKIWYIHPDTLQRYWFNGSASSFTYLKSVADQR